MPTEQTATPLDLDAFLTRLRQHIDGSRLANALTMLKADRFHLFSQVEGDVIIGVVRAQSDPRRVYSCRLTADGSFSCCTQNLRICGGLRGAVCKHLLVMVVALTRSGALDPETIERWVRSSHKHRPVLDKDIMSATFLRYQGAQTGEVDWRPTETIPEDYYSL
ncbi:MAG TPA: hypothetical protein VEL76_26810 [Gemmataceae bacterium]|nr:hypothetical protein [Gemmataceae bacterium]